MKYLRIKLDDKNGYLKAFENRNKNGKNSAPDFKGEGIAVWMNESSTVETAQQAADAGAADPVPGAD